MEPRPEMTSRKIIRATAAIASLAASPALAGNFQDLGELDVAVAAHMGAGIGEPGGARAPIDRRLKLKACPDVPDVSGPVLGAAVVRCEQVGWSIRVPLRLDGQASGGTARQNASNQEESDAVTRGQVVRLSVEGNGFSLARTMIADATGKVGDLISVRADRRSKPILARITGVGEVSVPGN